ncbi:MAG: biopolymer transporter ExbD [bacterium]|nr:biopolymer transporter ExbD [bacterium]
MRLNHSSTIPGLGKLAPSTGKSAAKLEMTSLVDMMVILVVFLLMSFSADDQIVTSATGIKLPSSSSKSTVSSGLVVEVGLDHVVVDGRSIMSSKALSGVDPTELVLLTNALKEGIGGSNQQNILVQADRRVKYDNLSQVLRACAEAGLSDVSLVVLGGVS